MPKEEIAGQEYVGPIATMDTILKAEHILEKVGEAIKAHEWDKYAILYVERAKLFCSGEDMQKLSPKVLTRKDWGKLESFFGLLREDEPPALISGNETLPDSGASTSEP